MNTKKIYWIIVLVLTLMVLATGSASVAIAQNGTTDSQALARMEITSQKITWYPTIHYPYSKFILSIGGPGARSWELEFSPQALPFLEIAKSQGVQLLDGYYDYTLRAQVILSPEALAAMQAARESDDPQAISALQASGVLPPGPFEQSGSFSVLNGAFLTQLAEETNFGASKASSGVPIEDIVQADDVIITGSECIGYDCATDGSESFGFSTIKLKENNLRITFDDTSAIAGFPNVDWQISANDSVSGGLNKFSIEDLTNVRIPFTIEANARSNALYVDDGGRVGLGTSSPVLLLHLVRGDTPSVRLEQDTSSGWTAQTWDIAGNESNFFVRDTTGGSALPFRIQPGAPTNLLTLRAGGSVGVGTWSPAATLHVYSAAPTMLVSRSDGKTTFSLDSSGNLLLGGLLTEASDVNLKENLRLVDAGQILDLVVGLPIYTWNYREDQDDAAHVGPMAQDFYAAFELGADDRHIASLDANGVALASVQALYTQLKDQQTQISQLEQQNADLEARLVRLEAAAGLGAPMTALFASIAVAALVLALVAVLLVVLVWRIRQSGSLAHP